MKYTITAKQVKHYEIEVEASDPASAIDSLDDWIAEDFENFQVNGKWELEAH
jgi:hypothetical protein